MKTVRELYLDILLYGGNSGGPVYFYYENRRYQNTIHFGYQRGVLGLVIQQANSSVHEFADKILNYGVIVPAIYIKETMELLPETAPRHSFVRPNIIFRPTIPPQPKKK